MIGAPGVRGLRLAVAALVFVVAVGGQFAWAATDLPAKGEIGGPPSIAVGPPDEGAQATPPFVIGRVEIVAYGLLPPAGSGASNHSRLCVVVEYLSAESNFRTCGSLSDLAPPPGAAFRIERFSQLIFGQKGSGQTEIDGSLAPDVAFIRGSFRRQGSEKLYRLNAIVAQVRGELQAALGQSAPFGYFVVKVRGLVVQKSLRVRALDATGRVIGSAGGASLSLRA